MTNDRMYKGILALLILVLLVIALASSCVPVKTVEVKDADTNFKYEKLVIEGMPCVLWDKYNFSTSSRSGGLTCNWDYWDGNLNTWLGE